MKCLSVLLLAILPFIGFGQDLTEDQLKIYRANEVVFYGYDFSNFKLAEAKRMYDGNIKKIIPQVIEKTGEIITEKMLRSQLRK